MNSSKDSRAGIQRNNKQHLENEKPHQRMRTWIFGTNIIAGNPWTKDVMKLLRSAFVAMFTLVQALAYTQEDRDVANKSIEEMGYPIIGAWSKMTPKQLVTMLTVYSSTLMKEGAFEHFDAKDLEVLHTAVSATNNCEFCLSFLASMMLESSEPPTLSKEEVDEIMAGGLPKDTKMRTLVTGAKYALAHKGIILPREKLHLESMGIFGEKLTELIFAVGVMNAVDMNYVHLISQGLELEEFLQKVGPFAKTVYKRDELGQKTMNDAPLL
jgi:hypothetical protein